MQGVIFSLLLNWTMMHRDFFSTGENTILKIKMQHDNIAQLRYFQITNKAWKKRWTMHRELEQETWRKPTKREKEAWMVPKGA